MLLDEWFVIELEQAQKQQKSFQKQKRFFEETLKLREKATKIFEQLKVQQPTASKDELFIKNQEMNDFSQSIKDLIPKMQKRKQQSPSLNQKYSTLLMPPKYAGKPICSDIKLQARPLHSILRLSERILKTEGDGDFETQKSATNLQETQPHSFLNLPSRTSKTVSDQKTETAKFEQQENENFANLDFENLSDSHSDLEILDLNIGSRSASPCDVVTIASPYDMNCEQYVFLGESSPTPILHNKPYPKIKGECPFEWIEKKNRHLIFSSHDVPPLPIYRHVDPKSGEILFGTFGESLAINENIQQQILEAAKQ